MKKFLGAICSAAVGALTFLFLSLDSMVSKTTAGSLENKSALNAWDLIGESSEYAAEIQGYTLYKISTIALIIVASLLILSAIILLLQNLKVFKSKVNFAGINNVLLTIFAVLALVAVIAVFVMAKDLVPEAASNNLSVYAGLGAWLNLAVGAVACVAGWAVAKK